MLAVKNTRLLVNKRGRLLVSMGCFGGVVSCRAWELGVGFATVYLRMLEGLTPALSKEDSSAQQVLASLFAALFEV